MQTTFKYQHQSHIIIRFLKNRAHSKFRPEMGKNSVALRHWNNKCYFYDQNALEASNTNAERLMFYEPNTGI